MCRLSTLSRVQCQSLGGKLTALCVVAFRIMAVAAVTFLSWLCWCSQGTDYAQNTVFWVKVPQRPFNFLLTLKETTCLYCSSHIFLPTLEHKGSPWICIRLWGLASTQHYKCWGQVVLSHLLLNILREFAVGTGLSLLLLPDGHWDTLVILSQSCPVLGKKHFSGQHTRCSY